MKSIHTLSNSELLAELELLSVRENETTIEILRCLIEIDQRKLYLEEGYSSLFCYCTQSALRYSEPAAIRRITCARTAARFPEVLDLLKSKQVNLSTLSLAAGIMTEGNKEEVLAGICGRSRREVEDFVAAYRPCTGVPKERIKPLVVAKGNEPCGNLFEQASPISPAKSCAFAAKEPQLQVEKEQRYELKFSVSAQLMEKINQARCVLSGKYPCGVQLEELLAEAVDVLLEARSPIRRMARRRMRTVRAPLKAAPVARKRSRCISQKVRDEVFVRDKGRCAFVGRSGVRCSETKDLEIHHVLAFAKGGANEPDNLRLLCRSHNLHQAEQDFGIEQIKAAIAARGH